MQNIQKIKREIEAEWKMGGLSDGLYGDFADETVKRILTELYNEVEKNVSVHKFIIKTYETFPREWHEVAIAANEIFLTLIKNKMQ